MKTAFLIALPFLFFLAACLPRVTETPLAACPVVGLEKLAFYAGSPTSGTRLAPVAKEDRLSWEFGFYEGSIYAVCHYRDGFERVQVLPQTFRACTAVTTGAGIGRVTCRAWL